MVSPDAFTANWLHIEGGGRGGVSLGTFTGKGCIVGGGEGGGSALIRGHLLPWAATPPPPLVRPYSEGVFFRAPIGIL